jgi:cyclin H
MVTQPSPGGDTNQVSEITKSLETSSGGQSGRRSLWEGSSQCRHWRYSKEQLLQQRTQINGAAVSAIKNAFEADEVSILFIR